MDDRKLKFLAILVLIFIVALYFSFIQLGFNEVLITKLDGNYIFSKNALTRVQTTIVYVTHIIQLFIWTLLILWISKKRNWSTLPLGQWISKLCLANLVVLIISLIIIAIVRHVLVGSFWSNIENAGRPLGDIWHLGTFKDVSVLYKKTGHDPNVHLTHYLCVFLHTLHKMAIAKTG